MAQFDYKYWVTEILSVEISLWLAAKWIDVVCAYVTSSSKHNSGARGLKIGMQNPYMDGSKVAYQIFDILPRS